MAREMPDNPGVYLMKNSEGTVIYVGKAKNLKRRVTSYFLPGRNVKTAALVEKIDTIDFVITGNEYEALILENNLIKKYNPHYNILLKDGKSYPVIRITKEDFPRVFKTRRVIRDGSLYFGPYPDGSRLEEYLRMVDDNYPIRRCQGPLKPRKMPCLYHHIHKCSAPCIGAIDEMTLRFFNPTTKQYEDRKFEEQMEIANLTGNVSTLNGETYLHVHVTLGRADFTALAGHLLSARVHGAGEFIVEDLQGRLERSYSDEVGLNLYDFSK